METQIASPDIIDSAILGLPRSYRQFKVNEWRLNYPQINVYVAFASGNLVLTPTPIPFDFTLDGLGCLCAAAGTAGTVRTVLFPDSNGSPGVGIADTGAISITSTGVKSAIGLGVTGSRGLYWAGILTEGVTGSPTFSQVGTPGQTGMVPWQANPFGTGSAPVANTGNDGFVAAATGVSGSQVGATFGGSLVTNSNAPNKPIAVWFRFSAITL